MSPCGFFLENILKIILKGVFERTDEKSFLEVAKVKKR